jgi:hypothetical protein
MCVRAVRAQWHVLHRNLLASLTGFLGEAAAKKAVDYVWHVTRNVRARYPASVWSARLVVTLDCCLWSLQAGHRDDEEPRPLDSNVPDPFCALDQLVDKLYALCESPAIDVASPMHPVAVKARYRVPGERSASPSPQWLSSLSRIGGLPRVTQTLRTETLESITLSSRSRALLRQKQKDEAKAGLLLKVRTRHCQVSLLRLLGLDVV